jgi:glycosyltransferase involved in cell wall biosynthesis
MPASRPRVLLIAELCNPDWVSVPLEGWSLYHALTEVADVHLVTQVRNRENILKQGVREGSQFTALDSTPVEKPLDKVGQLLRGSAGVGWTTATALSVLPYYYFEEVLWQRFGARIRAREFDLVHRYTPISPTTPSTLAARCKAAGVPFLMGPLNGGLPWPKGFGGARRREKEWLSYIREAYKLMPFYKSTRENASAILTGSRATRGQLAQKWQGKTVYIPENAIDPKRFGTAKSEGPVKPYKGMALLMEAAAPLIREGKVVLEYIGDGQEMPNLKAQAAREGIEAGVTFAGWVKHQELQGRLAKNHVFGFPSVREFGGAVVCEAMALGLVPIVMDYGGPGEIVSPATGFAIPMGTPEQIVVRVREVLAKLAADPSVIRPMGERARERVFKYFTWKAKAEQVLEVYRWLQGERSQPDWGMPLAD